MATRKQRRRREKEKRHDYEFVYLDSEGNEVEPDEEDLARPAKRAGSSNGKASASQRGSSRRREPQPPSWQRVFKRGAIFLPIFIATVILIGGKHVHASAVIFQALILIVLFVPFSYFLDSMVWRSYQKRLGRSNTGKK